MKCRQMKVEEEEQKSGKLGIAEGTGGFCPAPAEMRGSGGHWAHTGASSPIGADPPCQHMALTGGEDMRGKLNSIRLDADTIYIRGIWIKKEFWQFLVLATGCLLPLLRLLLIFRQKGRAKIGPLHPKPVLCIRRSLRETGVCIF